MIDAHVHVAPPNLPGTGTLHPLFESPPETVAATLRREMRLAGCSAALAMGELDAGPDDPLGVNRTLALTAWVPGLHAIGAADPRKGGDPEHLDRVRRALREKRVVALKCYLGYLHFEPAHPGYRPYYELAQQFKLPVIFHTGDTFSARGKLKYSHPLGVDEVAVDHPNVCFVLAHLGNPWMRDAAEVVYKNLNVHADLSGLVVGDGSAFHDEEQRDTLSDLTANLKRAFRYAERPNRFLFGSDWPLIPCGPYAEFIRGAIPTGFHDDVFRENAKMLFKV